MARASSAASWAVADAAVTSVIGNVGDDVEVLGLHVSPDLDSILYALAGIADEERGWGRSGETWRALETVGALGGEDWFALGDLDLGLHLVRTQALARGRAALCRDGAAGEGARRRRAAAAGDRRPAAYLARDAGGDVPVPGVVRRPRAPGRGRRRALRGRGRGASGARGARGDRWRGPDPACAEQSVRLDRADPRRERRCARRSRNGACPASR